MRSLRKICGVTLAERVRNTELRERLYLKGCVGLKMKKGMLQLFGHIEKKPDKSLTKQIHLYAIT